MKFQKLTLGAGPHAFRMKGQFGMPTGFPPTFNPITQGALFFAQSSDGKAVVYQIPPGALGVGGCGPEDGWVLSGRNYGYPNESGALPPGCAAFSSGGLTKVRLRDDARPDRASDSASSPRTWTSSPPVSSRPRRPRLVSEAMT